ncbi:4-epi-cubebol synthase [Streptosporangium sp. NPDC020072]|uniref:Terpene synthase n=1 Tax=Streptosporangium jomthongense TaxID=1193683 RepID=A0ABV8F999_9ACTN
MSPHVERVDRETLDWLIASGMLKDAETVERYRQARYGWLGGRTYPYAEHDLLRLVTDWCVWLFAFDDAFCESDRRAAEIARALPQFYAVLEGLDGGYEVDDRFARMLLEIKNRISAHADGDQLDRWCSVTKDYLFAQVWEAANREDEVVPSIEDYLFMRRRTGAMLTVFALIDIAAGHRLTPAEWRHPAVRAITESANDVVVWDNDLISYAKESESGNARNNLVNVLAVHGGVSRQAAMERIGMMRNKAITDMIERRPTLEALGSEAVHAYVRGLEFWISGSVDYSLTSSRYTMAWRQRIAEE